MILNFAPLKAFLVPQLELPLLCMAGTMMLDRAIHTQAVRDKRLAVLEQRDVEAFAAIMGEDALSGVVMDPHRLESHNR